MASRFSGVLQLTDLDDFITPSQVKLKYLFTLVLSHNFYAILCNLLYLICDLKLNFYLLQHL